MREAAVALGMWICVGSGVLAGQNADAPPAATVTFYGGGSLMQGLLPGSRNVAFQGCIFDGPQQVGCATFGQFISVRMAAGLHTFSASLSSRHPADNSQLSMNLEPGKNYFVRAVVEDHPFRHAVGSSQGRLDVVSCEVAHDETRKLKMIREGKWKPAPDKNLGPLYKQAALAEIPECASAP